MMQMILKKHTVAIIAGVVCVLVVGGYLLAFRMLHGTYEELRAAQQELAWLVEDERTHDALAALVVDIEPERRELEQYFLSASNPTPLLSIIEELSQSAGVSVSVESLSEHSAAKKDEEGPKLPSVEVALSVSGSWGGVYHLIRLLEHLPYVVMVEGVVLEESSEEGRLVWEGQIRLRVFTQK